MPNMTINKHEHELRMAAAGGNLRVVKDLVEYHDADDYDLIDDALRMAAEDGHLHIVKYLVEEWETDDYALNDALRMAVENGHLQVVKYLKRYIVSQFTKRHIDKLNVNYASKQYKLPFEIQQLILTYV